MWQALLFWKQRDNFKTIACQFIFLILRDRSFIRGGGGGGERLVQMGGRVIKFYVAKKGRGTKYLSWALGRAIPFLANIAVHLK